MSYKQTGFPLIFTDITERKIYENVNSLSSAIDVGDGSESTLHTILTDVFSFG